MMQRLLFPDYLGDRSYQSLTAAVRRTHEFSEKIILSGAADVEHGRGLLTGLLRFLFRFPKAGMAQDLQVVKQRTKEGEIWTRTFSSGVFRSSLSLGKLGVIERFGLFRFLLELNVKDGELHYFVSRAWFLGIPWPHVLLPVSVAKEYSDGDRFHFDVALYAPISRGLIVHYRGYLDILPITQ